MKSQDEIIFLFDCDNTLLDNDRVLADLQEHLDKHFGQENKNLYLNIYEDLRNKSGCADYLGALQSFRLETNHDLRMLEISSFLLDYPFAECLFPRALDVIQHFARWGPTVIFSDGDVLFQQRKIQASGLWKAVDGRVLIYKNNEEFLAELQMRYPARQYVMVNDKLHKLAAMKQAIEQASGHLTTVFARQGNYARHPDIVSLYPAADLSVRHIADLLKFDLPSLLEVSISADESMQEELHCL